MLFNRPRYIKLTTHTVCPLGNTFAPVIGSWQNFCVVIADLNRASAFVSITFIFNCCQLISLYHHQSELFHIRSALNRPDTLSTFVSIVVSIRRILAMYPRQIHRIYI